MTINGHVKTKARSCPNKEALFAESRYYWWAAVVRQLHNTTIKTTMIFDEEKMASSGLTACGSQGQSIHKLFFSEEY